MEKYIPYEKLSKKEKRKADSAKRSTWGTLKPVTRKPESSRAYNRRKAQSWRKDIPEPVPFHFYCVPMNMAARLLLLTAAASLGSRLGTT